MKTKTNNFTLKTTVILMQMAFASLAYAADINKELDPETAELVNPVSKVELGVGNVSEGSFKAGEYNGHEDKGAYGIANIDLRGGGTYDSDETLRWRITGKNLGLENRNIKGEIGDQGKFRLEFGYDELLRNRSDSYQTPYSGASSSNLTLPSGWVAPIVPSLSGSAANARGLSSEVSNSPAYVYGTYKSIGNGLITSVNITTSSNIQAHDLPAFHLMELSTKREKYDAGMTYDFDEQWQFKASARHEDKTGYKPMGSITRASGGDISTILPDRIDQTTDQFNAALGFTGDKGFLQAAYYGSIFDNHVSSMSWQNWSYNGTTSPPVMATMSSAPSNEFNQFSLTGGYNFNHTTKLTMNGSYARNTQNDKFLTDAFTPVVPRSSLDGLVETTAFNVKLTAKPLKDLNFTGGYKYENRDNKTPVNVYGFYDDSEPSTGALNAGFKTALANLTGIPLATLNTLGLGSNLNINANRAYSKESQQVNLYADYMLKKGQWVGAGYDWQGINRKCDGSWISCTDADKSNEHTLKLDWRTSSIENVTTKLDYAYSQRTVNYNENAFLALVPMANVMPTESTATMSAYATMLALGYSGYGPVLGYPATALSANTQYFFANNNALGNAAYQNANRISELIGMRRYNMADRDRNKLKSSINWQATDRLSFQGGFNFNYDDYANSAYGLKSAKDWALNLDGSFAVSEDFTLTSFYNHEDQQSKSAGNTYTANAAALAAGSVSNNSLTTFTLGSANSISGGCAATVSARNTNYKTLSCLDWSNNMQDKIDTVGLAFKRNKLFVSNFDMAGSLTFTWARTDNGVSGGNYVNNATNASSVPTNGAGTPDTSQYSVYYIPATALPTVTSKIFALQLNGKYKINKASSVWVGYNFQHMTSDDYAYQGMQVGGLAGVLPTSEKAPSYNVHNLGASYTYMF